MPSRRLLLLGRWLYSQPAMVSAKAAKVTHGGLHQCRWWAPSPAPRPPGPGCATNPSTGFSPGTPQPVPAPQRLSQAGALWLLPPDPPGAGTAVRAGVTSGRAGPWLRLAPARDEGQKEQVPAASSLRWVAETELAASALIRIGLGGWCWAKAREAARAGARQAKS